MKEESQSDVLVSGMSDRNRSIHGDLVVLQLLPRSEWKSRSMALNVNQEGTHMYQLSRKRTTGTLWVSSWSFTL